GCGGLLARGRGDIGWLLSVPAMAARTQVTASRSDLAGLPDWPRGLSRAESARYIGISPSKFDELVKDHRMPAPKQIDGRRVWDRLGLDEAFAALPDIEGSANPWDKALGGDNANHPARRVRRDAA